MYISCWVAKQHEISCFINDALHTSWPMDHENESELLQCYYIYFFPIVTFVNNYELLGSTFSIGKDFISLFSYGEGPYLVVRVGDEE